MVFKSAVSADKHWVEGRGFTIFRNKNIFKSFAKQIDQKREAAKPYGENPMQAAANAAKRAAKTKKKVRNRPDVSRKAKGFTTVYKNGD